MADTAETKTLTSGAVSTFTLGDYEAFVVKQVSGTPVAVYGRDGGPAAANVTDPVAAADNNWVLPAVLGAEHIIRRGMRGQGTTIIKVIAVGTPVISVNRYDGPLGR